MEDPLPGCQALWDTSGRSLVILFLLLSSVLCKPSQCCRNRFHLLQKLLLFVLKFLLGARGFVVLTFRHRGAGAFSKFFRRHGKLRRKPDAYVRARGVLRAKEPITEEDDDSDLQSDDGFEEFIYEGSFRNGRRFGPGVMTSGKSLRYEGQFQNDVFHGHGVATFADGGTYTGQWADGQKCGHGEYITGDGLKYVGSWKNGHKHGAGSQEYQGGGRYEGDWKLGMCDGKGQFFFVDGSLYEGWWSKGRHNGPGVLKKPDGSREQHFYEEGLLTKREVHALPKLSDFASMLRRPSIICQVRTNVHEKVRLPSLEVSKKLMSPECAEIDLSAPPLRSARRTSPQKKSQSQTYPLCLARD